MKQLVTVALLVLMALFATSVAAAQDERDERMAVTINYNFNEDVITVGVFSFDTPVYGVGVVEIGGTEQRFTVALQPGSNVGIDFAAPPKGTAKLNFQYRFESHGLNSRELNRSVSWDDEPFVSPPPSPPGFPCFWWCGS